MNKVIGSTSQTCERINWMKQKEMETITCVKTYRRMFSRFQIIFIFIVKSLNSVALKELATQNQLVT